MEEGIPSDSQIIGFYEKYETPVHIRDHMQVVATIVFLLAREIKRTGIYINIDKARAAAYLHDIAKIFQLEEEKMKLLDDFSTEDVIHHASLGKAIMEKEGYPEIGRLVSLHLGSLFIREPDRFVNLEEKIVLLADMRVLNTSICSLDERIQYIEERYGLYFGEGKQELKKLEKEIFDLAGIDIEKLQMMIKEHGLEELA
ncbi:MAG: HD domain-containing protein [Promethearchaeota archaeon]